ncbi:hypothetical protein CDD82_3538 [Ophiocordyceps australis]|uniref:F-box domain-containing protein n=1 Tax=Ophiocordyceps australis TaxID=1399860 RepID=A0A2C5ZC56_9HYPO|nr:hypothetical protein CDD82_3538 [Ophiocordyceps australis]
MKLPTEILHLVYSFLSPLDFNAARHCCRAWFVASLDGLVLMDMVRRGGWWSSMVRTLSPLSALGRGPSMSKERVMSKWICRECAMLRLTPTAFCEAGMVEFGSMVPKAPAGSLRGAVAFMTSLCSKYLVVTHGQIAYVYELNHVCSPRRSAWAVPLRRRQGLPLGHLRPVTTIVCPRRILSSSMDTSAGRYSIAFLMDGRVGMVCDVASEMARHTKTPLLSPTWSDTSLSSSPSSSSSMSDSSGLDKSTPCVCVQRVPSRPPRVEIGQRCVYRNICHADDPPRRWFPLSSPSDFLYFLPARRGVDTARRLRLISSAAGVGNPLDSLGDILHGFSTTLLGSGSTAVVSLVNTPDTQALGHEQELDAAPVAGPAARRPINHFAFSQASCAGLVRKVAAGYADHYRAVPLSDGYHILFTDPRSGNLCLGTDAPVGSLTRLLRKVWFLPPDQAVSPVPILYAAGADRRHGVRVVATFAADLMNADADWQVVAFYTVPPDVFYDLSQGAAMSSQTSSGRASQGRRRPWWLRHERLHGDEAANGEQQPVDHDDAALHPIQITGQAVATCSNLTELAVEASPEMIVWAFSADGWARTWALDCGRDEPSSKTAVQRDGSVRVVDQEGDVRMAECDSEDGGVDVNVEGSDESSHDGDEHGNGDEDEDEEDEGLSTVHLQRYDGATATSPGDRRWCKGAYSMRRSDRMSGTASVYLVEELVGIVRLEVELR